MTIQNIRAILNLGIEFHNTEDVVALADVMIKSLVSANNSLDLTDEERACIREIGRWEGEQFLKVVSRETELRRNDL